MTLTVVIVFAALPEDIPVAIHGSDKTKPDWGKRIQRAIDLAEKHPGTAEVLAFYRRILKLQKTMFDEIASRPARALDVASPFREQLDVDVAAKHLAALLSLVQRSGPSKLAQEAAKLSASSEQRRQMLRDFLADGDDAGPASFFARVLLQPQAESLAAAQATQLAGFSGSVCPVCGARPQVAVLHPEGDGGKRSLVCSFCVTEWEFRRILCPTCGEEDYRSCRATRTTISPRCGWRLAIPASII